MWERDRVRGNGPPSPRPSPIEGEGEVNTCASVMDVAAAFRLMDPAEAAGFKAIRLEIVKMLYKLR